MDKEDEFHFDAAVYFLKNVFGIDKPTNKQIEEMKSLIFHNWLKKKIGMNEQLTKQENMYLLLASQGKTYREIAEILKISPKTVRFHESNVLKKLNCKNMKQAIYVGMRYGELG